MKNPIETMLLSGAAAVEGAIAYIANMLQFTAISLFSTPPHLRGTTFARYAA